MKQALRTITACIVATALMAPVALMAQKEEKEKESKDKKEVQQYIITRKGNSNEKTVIEINGDKITVNGKPIDENKDGDISVRRMKYKELGALARTPRVPTF